MIFINLNKELSQRTKYVPTPKELDLLNRALSMAECSVERFRVGAADNGNHYGHNTTSLHAEINMLGDGAHSSRKATTVAVARLGRDNKWRCSYPCVDCHAALRAAGYARLVCFDEGGQPVALSL